MNKTRQSILNKLLEVRKYFRLIEKECEYYSPLWYRDVLRGTEETDDQYLKHTETCLEILKEHYYATKTQNKTE